MRAILLPVLFLLAAGWSSICAQAQSGSPNIVKTRPTVSYKYYPPDSTPPPEVLPGMKGNTRYNFPFGANYNFAESRSKSDKGCVVALMVNSLDIHISLALDITLPKGCIDRLKDHEEGHRHIYEYFYENFADAAAHKAAGDVFGKPVKGEGRNCKEAKEAAIAMLGEKLSGQYRKLVSDPAKNANDYYDELTNHGRFEDVLASVAAEKAIKSYTKNDGSLPAPTQAVAAPLNEKVIADPTANQTSSEADVKTPSP